MGAEKSANLEKVKQRKLYLLRLRVFKNKAAQLERKQESLSSLLRQARADLVVKLEACDNLKRFKGGYQWNNTRAQIRGIKADTEERERRLAELQWQEQFEEEFFAHLFDSEPEEEVLAQEEWRNHIID